MWPNFNQAVRQWQHLQFENLNYFKKVFHKIELKNTLKLHKGRVPKIKYFHGIFPIRPNNEYLSWGYVDFKMPANENALTQPKFELGICGIIQDVFQGDYTTKQKFETLLEKN